MNNKKNFVSSLIFQFIHTIYGLIIPKLIITNFGSEVNGLVSSITQFLSFISLLEGGLGAVVLAELYKPIEEKNNEKINRILTECQNFFTKLTICFAIYTLLLSIIYSVAVRDQFDIFLTSSVVLILSLTTVAQYLFSITFRLYLQASQKLYLVNNISSLTLVGNIVLSILTIKVFPDIRGMILCASLLFFIQPLLYSYYIGNKVKIKRGLKVRSDKLVLCNRWSGFAQNMAHYVNTNTDIVLITLFSTFENVSVYSVYLMAVNAIRNILVSVTSSYQSALGKYIAQKQENRLKEHFFFFLYGIWSVCIVLFSTCLLLSNQFVKLYVAGVNDANYYQPTFALIIIIATCIYCMREPIRFLILSAGKFKETNFGSVMEAILNLSISLFLIHKYGLVGVAIGTLIAISYRMVYFLLFLKKNIIYTPINYYILPMIKATVIIAMNILVYYIVDIEVSSVISFIVYGIIISLAEIVLVIVLFLGPTRSKEYLKLLINKA